MELPYHLVLELYDTVDEGVKGGVSGGLNVVARVEFISVLADDYFALVNALVTEDFNAKALGDRVSAETGTTSGFFVSHEWVSSGSACMSRNGLLLATSHAISLEDGARTVSLNM
jgi:hypothetical protein